MTETGYKGSMTLRILPCLLAAAFLAGCSSPPPPPRDPPPQQRATPREDARLGSAERNELLSVSSLIVVGLVEERISEPTGQFYRVRVREVVVDRERLEADEPAPLAERGQLLRVNSFIYYPGARDAELGSLRSDTRYLFFLAPAHNPDEWLNLADAARFPLPEAGPTLESLRAPPLREDG